jgi:predicted acyltransferase
MPTPDHTSQPAQPAARLTAVDALRGFDMFWIIGGDVVAQALDRLHAGPVVSAVAGQLVHADWDGFHFYDLIFPLFLFLIGVAIVLSMDRMLARDGRKAALIRIARRSALLFLLGVFVSGGLTRPWPDVQILGVLPRIALCYGIAASLYALLPRSSIVIAAVACLAGYWALMSFVPFPDVKLKHDRITRNGMQATAKPPEAMLEGVTATARGTFEEGHNLTHYVDYRCLPGWKRNLYYTNEGILSTIPAVATTLFGIMAGWILTGARWNPRQKVNWLLAGGAALAALGLLWGLEFPIIKRIWTSSFCLVASGCSAMLLGVFYLVVDVWRWQRWCTPFLWIGANALTIYLVTEVITFQPIAARLAGGDVKDFLDAHIMPGVGALLIALVALSLPVLMARFLYQRKIFIKL